MKMDNPFRFAQVVIVEKIYVGVIVKLWGESSKGNKPYCEVYVRSFNRIIDYPVDEIKHYILHKEISEDDLGYYENG
jgi:hypothetical protein